MIEPISNEYLIPFGKKLNLNNCASSPSDEAADQLPKKNARKKLAKKVRKIAAMQHKMYAQNQYSLLLIFQAMDAAGKDGTIKAVMSGINPAGCQVFSFKKPSEKDLEHDFLWRTSQCLPERGRIGIFNRSYYEETLVVKVHPEFLHAQNLPDLNPDATFWKKRYESICTHEKHLAQNGTVILKFWLNISYEEQKSRFLSRLNEPEKHWKFSSNDVHERSFWPEYMKAYQSTLAATSKPWAPWYAIPADNKPYMRLQVAKIIAETMKSMELHYPEVKESEQSKFEEMKQSLLTE